MNIKKIAIILALTFFLIQVSHASDINESVSAEINDIIIHEIIEVDEAINEMVLSVENDEETIDDSILEDNIPPEEYSDSEIINYDEKYFNFEIFTNQYHIYMNEILDESLDNSTEFDQTDDEIHPFFNNIYYKALTGYQILICDKLGVNFQSDSIIDNDIEFGKLGYNKITLLCLEYANENCFVLAQVDNKDIIFCGDKLNSKFAYSIDNSIVGSASNFNNYLSNFSFINYPHFYQYFFTGYYLSECVYDFFSVLNNRMNEVFSFRI